MYDAKPTKCAQPIALKAWLLEPVAGRCLMSLVLTGAIVFAIQSVHAEPALDASGTASSRFKFTGAYRYRTPQPIEPAAEATQQTSPITTAAVPVHAAINTLANGGNDPITVPQEQADLTGRDGPAMSEPRPRNDAHDDGAAEPMPAIATEPPPAEPLPSETQPRSVATDNVAPEPPSTLSFTMPAMAAPEPTNEVTGQIENANKGLASLPPPPVANVTVASVSDTTEPKTATPSPDNRAHPPRGRQSYAHRRHEAYLRARQARLRYLRQYQSPVHVPLFNQPKWVKNTLYSD